MYVVDLTDTDYSGSLQRLDNSNKTARERRGKYKANKRAPRGMYGTGRVQARGTTRAPLTVVQPTTMSYTERIARYGAVGTLED